jgi:acyl-CoA synthetase (AMP-forming)/AMP-acid ligase II
MGIGPEMVVGICVERSPAMVVGLPAILKAGGAYLPLDPAYPPARLTCMLADSRARVLLTQARLADELRGGGAEVLCLDTDWPVVELQASTNPRSVARPSNLAYCMYTSGSMGRPKGVVVEHANVVAFLAWAARAFPRQDMARVLLATSISFDLSVFELFAPLAIGGSAMLVRDALALIESPVDPTLINTVPSAIQALANANAIPESVRVINLAGEPLQRALVKRLRAIAPKARVYSLYGPTECTTYLHRWAKGDPTVGTARLFWRGRILPHKWLNRRRVEAVRAFTGEVPEDARAQKAVDEYRPRVYPGPVKLFVPMERSIDPGLDPYSGPWNNWAGGGLEICEVNGDHLGMFEEPNIQILGANLRAYLEQAKEWIVENSAVTEMSPGRDGS